ncbi:MAG: cupin domain-containing protein [Saprospiraceae bacterium]|nr:cupin domain-containing protein [Saprospiraceae bacterium]MCB9325439.1 cupin domain-containing protein [Lewinellaceae bacterium]
MEPQILPTREADEYYSEERCFILELFNQPGGVASIARARVEPGVTTALHALDGLECYYLLSGEGKMEIHGKTAGKVKAGDTVVIPANAPQRITNTGQEDLVFLCFCAPGFMPENYRSLE